MRPTLCLISKETRDAIRRERPEVTDEELLSSGIRVSRFLPYTTINKDGVKEVVHAIEMTPPSYPLEVELPPFISDRVFNEINRKEDGE